MEDQIIVWEVPDGTVRYATCPARSKKLGETTQHWLLRQFNKTVRDNFPGAKRILNALMPDGQPFRPGAKKLFMGAWRHDGNGNIQIDMPLARTIRMAEIRTERNKRLDASDREKQRIDEIGTATDKTAIAAYRQTLRDAPQNVELENFGAAEELQNYEPDWPSLPAGATE